MTNGEKQQIARMLKQGLGHTEIAGTLGMSVNTVKSYCRRSGLRRSTIGAKQESEKAQKTAEDMCRQCGAALVHTPGRKKKQFCSDACRLSWWHAHRELGRNARTELCPSCGKTFITDRVQTYCSHGCYVRARFGGCNGRNEGLSE